MRNERRDALVRIRRGSALVIPALILLFPGVAHAHPAQGEGLAAWLLHLASGWDHALPLAAALLFGIVIGLRMRARRRA